MRFDVSGGSRAKAVHPDATPRLCPDAVVCRVGTWASATRTCLAAASWAGLLVSAVSEYGFEVDFPLTPPLWLAIAVCVWLICSTHVAITCRTDRATNRVTRTQWVANTVSLIEPGTWIHSSGKSDNSQPSCRVKERLDHRVLRVRRGFEDSPQDCPNIPAAGITPLNFSGEVVNVPETRQSIILLNPTGARGPPWASGRSPQLFAYPLGRPTRYFYSASPLLEFTVNDLSTTRTAGNWSLDVAPPDVPIGAFPSEKPTSLTCLD